MNIQNDKESKNMNDLINKYIQDVKDYNLKNDDLSNKIKELKNEKGPII